MNPSGAIQAMGVEVEEAEGGALLEVRLAAGRGNVIASPVIRGLDEAFRRARETPAVKAVLLAARGPDFSWGASVEEHLPGREAAMLRSLHSLFAEMLETPVTVVTAVRGTCLGGGLELACVGHRIVAAPDARLGQPEIRLGVFPPAASVLLKERVGRPAAEDLCLTGRIVPAEEALRMRLVDEVATDPEEAARAWIRAHLLPHSASSLRWAVTAMRADLVDRLPRAIDAAERLYLGGLMATRDAEEGLRAFLEKRPPRWSDE
jgi:cyclohexa-1,5-dienecarbonyl-CoA hydratase